MNLFWKKSKTSSGALSKPKVKVLKAVNGGARGHRDQEERRSSIRASSRQLADFWKEIDERESEGRRRFSQRQKQYSHDTQRTRQLSSSSSMIGGDDMEFWKQPSYDEEEESWEDFELEFCSSQLVIEELPALSDPSSWKKGIISRKSYMQRR